MSMPEVEHCLALKRSKFYAALAEEIISFVDGFGPEEISTQTSNTLPLDIESHSPMLLNHMEQILCVVC